MIKIMQSKNMFGSPTFMYCSDTDYHKSIMSCDRCGRPVYTTFAFIILKLARANLLDKNYRPLCCYCYTHHV